MLISLCKNKAFGVSMRILFLYLVGDLGDRIRTMHVLEFLKSLNHDVHEIDLSMILGCARAVNFSDYFRARTS